MFEQQFSIYYEYLKFKFFEYFVKDKSFKSLKFNKMQIRSFFLALLEEAFLNSEKKTGQ